MICKHNQMKIKNQPVAGWFFFVGGNAKCYSVLRGLGIIAFSTSIHMSRDAGQDAGGSTGNVNKNFGADAAGFTLDYFAGDYAAVNSTTAFEADRTGTAYGAAVVPQYNGNIAGMVTTMLDNTQLATEVQGRAFQYDQLYRIKESMAVFSNG
jgi:hypothetical protein